MSKPSARAKAPGPPHLNTILSASSTMATLPTSPAQSMHTNAMPAAPRGIKRPASSTPPPKKRPYRRTKRPPGYNDKSTVTNASEEAILGAPVNVYDAVLGEAEDLLRASMEAQAMGRLKMASAYQLLLHTRLVGLGKRFDRSESQHGSAGSSMASSTPDSTLGTPSASHSSSTLTSIPRPGSLPHALKQLTSILPSNLEMDTAMVEHLARAAVELHHQRTGRKKSADGLLASPMTGMIGTPPAPAPTTKHRIGWTVEEKQNIAVSLQRNPKASAAMLAKQLANKTEAQVKAYLKNQQQQRKGSVELEQAMDADHPEEEDEAPKKKGGRGRKPPTTAMNTVPNANLDAKSLLKGNPTTLVAKKPTSEVQQRLMKG